MDARAEQRVRVPGPLRAWWQGGGRSELVRYASVGLGCSVLYTVLFLLLGGVGPVAANVGASLVGTVVGTELHRRLTFGAVDRVGWATAQWQSAGVAALGLVLTSVVLAVVEVVVPGSAWWEQVLVVNAATAVIGAGRYVVLRGWVFGTGSPVAA